MDRNRNLYVFSIALVAEIVGRKPRSVQRWLNKANPLPKTVWGPALNGKRGPKLYALTDLLIHANLRQDQFDQFDLLVRFDLDNRNQMPGANLGGDLEARIDLAKSKLNADQHARMDHLQSVYRQAVTDAFENDAEKLASAWRCASLLWIHPDILRAIWFEDAALPDDWEHWATTFATANKKSACAAE